MITPGDHPTDSGATLPVARARPGDLPEQWNPRDFVDEVALADADEVGSLEPLDRTDLRLLGDLAAIYDVVDPMPGLLPDLVLFSLDGLGAVGVGGAVGSGSTDGPMDDLDVELARLVESELAGVGPSGTRSVEHARRVTFASDNLTVMVVVHPHRDGSVRLDGWAAPGGGLRAELRSGDAVLSTDCDDAGRFVFDLVPGGPAQLVLHPTQLSDPILTVPVVTPAVHL